MGGRNQEDVIPNKYSAFLLLFFLDLIGCYNQLLYSTLFFLHFEELLVVPFNPIAIRFFRLRVEGKEGVVVCTPTGRGMAYFVL